ncbi:MAG: CHAP domain-containing protein [Anaerolineales bacterium]|jgi:hypothetical protein
MLAGIAKPVFKSFWRLFLGGTLLFTTAFIPQADSHAAVAAKNCQCVDYVINRYHLTGRLPAGGAKNMGPMLIANGFSQVGTPRVGEVVVFQPRFGHGIWSTGHAAVIVKVQTWAYGKTYWLTTFRGANQGYAQSTEDGCKNISNMTILYPKSWGPNYIAYYAR